MLRRRLMRRGQRSWYWTQPAPRVSGLRAALVAGHWIVRGTVTAAGDYYCYWFVDGDYAGRTASPELTLPGGRALSVELLVHRRPDMEPSLWARAPRCRRETLGWIKSADPVDHYRLEYALGVSPVTWIEFGRVTSDGRWYYDFTGPPVPDLTWVTYRVTPVWNEVAGTPSEWAPRYIVGIPDGPGWAATYSAVSGRVTIGAS